MFWRHLIELRVTDREWTLSPAFPENLCRFRYTFSQGCQGILVAESSNGYPIHLMNTRSFSLKSDSETDVIQLSPSPLELPCLAFKAIQSTRQPGTKFAQILLEVSQVPLFNTLTLDLPKASTINAAEKAASGTNQQLLDANPDRLGATIYNNGTGTLFLEFDSPASPTTGFTVKVKADSYYEIPFGYTGAVDGVWQSPNGTARVREFLP